MACGMGDTVGYKGSIWNVGDLIGGRIRLFGISSTVVMRVDPQTVVDLLQSKS
jgi:hypothetical protein